MAQSMGARLRTLMKKDCIALPGAFNGFVGRMVKEHGFQGAKFCELGYISGAALTACAGVPDIGVLTLDHFSRVIREVGEIKLKIVISAVFGPCGREILTKFSDTGFGEFEMVTRTVKEYHHAGAAGLHIEDQEFPKRCGHLDGKTLIPTQSMVDKIQRARDASQACSNGEFIICARTDAAGVSGHGFDDAVARATAFVDAGADMIFPEGLHSAEEFQKFADAMKGLRGEAPNGGPFMLANMTEFGYHCVIFPVSTFRAAMFGVNHLLSTLKTTGCTEAALEQMYTRKELYETLGYTPGKEWVFPDVSKAKK